MDHGEKVKVETTVGYCENKDEEKRPLEKIRHKIKCMKGVPDGTRMTEALTKQGGEKKKQGNEILKYHGAHGHLLPILLHLTFSF